jgi:hypothetical protein
MTVTNPYIDIQIVPHADIMVIHFSSRHRPAGKFDRFPITGDVSHIYVNADRNWYTTGIPGIGNVEECAVWFKNQIEIARPQKIVTIGSSMGAYGAALFGGILGATTTICFGPEIILNLDTGLSNQDADCTDATLDVTRYGLPENLFLIAGCQAPLDILISRHFCQYKQVKVLLYPAESHAVSRYLHKKAKLVPLINSLINAGLPRKVNINKAKMATYDWHEWFMALDAANITADSVMRYCLSLPNLSTLEDITVFRRLLRKTGHVLQARAFVRQANKMLERKNAVLEENHA